jgi:hypothetical protein
MTFPGMEGREPLNILPNWNFIWFAKIIGNERRMSMRVRDGKIAP